MVEYYAEDSRRLLVLRPNRSMTWETNKKILLGMFIVSMIIGISFAAIGAWLILPFAGLEIALVGAGMYYVCWKLNFQETISIEAESLELKKGVYYPKQAWQWQLSSTLLLTRPSVYRMSPPTLFLQHLNERVEIGEFLNRTEKLELRDKLIAVGLPMRILPAQ